jgi:hypothetical protein
MSHPAHIPDRGDVSPGVVAQRLGPPLGDFEVYRVALERRAFPNPIPRPVASKPTLGVFIARRPAC